MERRCTEKECKERLRTDERRIIRKGKGRLRMDRKSTDRKKRVELREQIKIKVDIKRTERLRSDRTPRLRMNLKENE